jgi:hypothetical protein
LISSITASVTVLMNSGDTSVAVLIAQEPLDLAHRHPARVHGHDLVVEAREATLVLGNEQRLEAALPVARHIQPQRPVLGQHRLGAGTVAVVVGFVRPRRPRRIAQVVRQFGAQRPLDQRLLERHRRGLHRLRRHRPSHKLVDQLLRNSRQLRGRLPLAWHRFSLSSSYAPHTKFLTGSA